MARVSRMNSVGVAPQLRFSSRHQSITRGMTALMVERNVNMSTTSSSVSLPARDAVRCAYVRLRNPGISFSVFLVLVSFCTAYASTVTLCSSASRSLDRKYARSWRYC